jgi:enoyl-CoA hydratase/carnithine racemase
MTGESRVMAVAIQTLQLCERLPHEEGLEVESLAYGLLQGSADHVGWLARQRPAQPAPPGEIRLDRVGSALHIALHRSWALGAIDVSMRDGLYDAFTLASLDPDIERIDLRSAGKAFSIGADLTEFGTTRDPATAHAIRLHTLPARALLGCRERLHVHVHGACIGAGLEIAAFARRVSASRNAWFQLPELAMGLIPGAGGCVSISKRIGWARTAEMLRSGKRISAKTALGWGLIDAIMDD